MSLMRNGGYRDWYTLPDGDYKCVGIEALYRDVF